MECQTAQHQYERPMATALLLWIKYNNEFRTRNVEIRRNPQATSSLDIPCSVFDIPNQSKTDGIVPTAVAQMDWHE